MPTSKRHRLIRAVITLAGSTLTSAAWAQAAPPALATSIDPGDTAWMIAATGLVLMMSIPGLALFYCGMVRKKNVLATMAQTVVNSPDSTKIEAVPLTDE